MYDDVPAVIVPSGFLFVAFEFYHLFDISSQIKDAMKIGVIGGGAVGVELAGDILEDYQDKANVYLIHPRETLVNDKVNESFQSTIKQKLTSLGVNMVLGM